MEPRNGSEVRSTPAAAKAPVTPAPSARSVRAPQTAVRGPSAAVPPVPQSVFPSVPDLENPVVAMAGTPQGQYRVHADNKNASPSPGPGPAVSRQAPSPAPAFRSPAQPERGESGANSRPPAPAIVQGPSPESAPPAETAFVAHLVPVAEPAPEAAPQARAVPAPRPMVAVPAATSEVPPAAIALADKPPDPAPPPEPEPARSTQKNMPAMGEHLKKAEVSAPAPAAPPVEPAVSESAVRITAQPLTVPEARSATHAPESPRAEFTPPARVQAAAPVPEAVRAPAGSRNVEMHFTVDAGRVQVHVAERAGEVRVAVHTPDANLAGTLRQELPQLTSRLEQSGFHAETWHGPTGGAAEGTRAGEPAPGSPRQDTPDPQQRNSGGQQNEEQQRPQPPEEQAAPRPRREDFSWLFDAVRMND